jgi:hypothetical protein
MVGTSIRATTVKTAASAAVETSAATPTSVPTMLGKSGHSRANEHETSDSCEKSFQKGGLPHVSFLHPNGRWLLRRQTAFTYRTPIGVAFHFPSVQWLEEIAALRRYLL